jgi:hypothetical protein
MKKQVFTFAGLFVAVALMVTACSKDSVTVKTKTELITTGTWKFKGATANGADISNQNPPFSACNKDNILSFSANGSGNVNEGATKCNAGDPTDTPFTWSFLSNETTLHISTVLFTGGSNDFTLESVSESELVVSQGYTPIAGPTYLVKISFQH